MPKQITDLEIDEVSLVAKGANQHAKVTIAKSAKGNDTMGELFDENGNQVDEDSLQHGQVVFDETGDGYVYEEEGQEPIDTDQLQFDLEDEDSDAEDYEMVGKAFNPIAGLKRAKAMRGLARSSKMPKNKMLGAGTSGTTGHTYGQAFGGTTKYRTTTPRGTARNFGSAARSAAGAGALGGATAGMSGAYKAGAHLSHNSGAYKAGAAALGGGAAGAGGAVGYKKWKGGKSFTEEIREELSKSLTDKDRDDVISKALGQMEEMDTIAKSALQAANEERELRLHREYTEIAKSYNMPVDDEELGAALMHCAENLSDEDCEVIAKCLGAAGEVLFEEYGAIGGGDNADIFSQVTGEVAKSVGQEELSADQMVELLSTNPDLYDEYLSGQNF